MGLSQKLLIKRMTQPYIHYSDDWIWSRANCATGLSRLRTSTESTLCTDSHSNPACKKQGVNRKGRLLIFLVKGLRKGYKIESGWIKQKRMIFLKTVSILTIGRFYSLQTINSVIYLNFLCCLIREISPTSQQWTFALRKMLHYLLKHMPDLV